MAPQKQQLQRPGVAGAFSPFKHNSFSVVAASWSVVLERCRNVAGPGAGDKAPKLREAGYVTGLFPFGAIVHGNRNGNISIDIRIYIYIYIKICVYIVSK